jgi:hypothetical protein
VNLSHSRQLTDTLLTERTSWPKCYDGYFPWDWIHDRNISAEAASRCGPWQELVRRLLKMRDMRIAEPEELVPLDETFPAMYYGCLIAPSEPMFGSHISR